MLQNSFLLALLLSATQAIKLTSDDDGVLPSQTDGPADGFPTDECEGGAPEEYYDPICYGKEWIEFAWLDDPTYWACGKQTEYMEYAMCDIATGQWE